MQAWSAERVEAMRAADEARAIELSRKLMRTDSFIDFQPRVSPHLSRRPDLAPVFDVFERAYQAAHGNGRPVIALVSAPPQVGKTSAGQHACAGYLRRDPAAWLFYITYNDELAQTKSRDVRDYTKKAGVSIRTDSSAVARWQTEEGGGFLARGRSGGVTGQSKPDLVWLDDPYKDRGEAESAPISEGIAEMLSGVIMTRRHPHTSVVISHTRWTTSDVIATTREKLKGKIESLGVDLVEVNVPCVDEEGEPLITFGGRDRAYYDAQRLLVSESDWWSLYMGAPRPREGKLFRGVHTFDPDAMPPRMSRGIFLDLAYSAKKSSDWSCILHAGADLDAPRDRRPNLYLLDMERGRWGFDEGMSRVVAMQKRLGGLPVYMRTGGQEAALLETAARTHGLHVIHEPTKGDKLQNALAPSDDWNAGRILVPARSGTWDTGPFIGRVLDFSGKSDREVDDEIDVIITAHDRLIVRGPWSQGVGPVGVPAGHVAQARGGWL